MPTLENLFQELFNRKLIFAINFFSFVFGKALFLFDFLRRRRHPVENSYLPKMCLKFIRNVCQIERRAKTTKIFCYKPKELVARNFR